MGSNPLIIISLYILCLLNAKLEIKTEKNKNVCFNL
jgi:hypothetical protein